MRGSLALALVLAAGCTTRYARPPQQVECTRFVDMKWVVAAEQPIRRCYIHVYDPETWGKMSTASWLIARAFSTTYPHTLGALPIVNGFVSSMSEDEAAVLARLEGVSVYQCGRPGGVSDLDVIAYIQLEAERSERKVPQPETLRIPARADGAVNVAVCAALSKIRAANLEHEVEWEP